MPKLRWPKKVSAAGFLGNICQDFPVSTGRLAWLFPDAESVAKCRDRLHCCRMQDTSASSGQQPPRTMLCIPMFMPSLLSLFREEEQQSGLPLTYQRAREIVEGAVITSLSQPLATQLERRRGFHDLDPLHFWAEWLEFKDSGHAPLPLVQ